MSAVATSSPVTQQPDHERSVQDGAESERLSDIERDAEHDRRRDPPLQQRVEALVGRALEAERDLFGREHRLQCLHGGEVAPRVVADSHLHSGELFGTTDG
jgi:hypothetical protein